MSRKAGTSPDPRKLGCAHKGPGSRGGVCVCVLGVGEGGQKAVQNMCGGAKLKVESRVVFSVSFGGLLGDRE